MCIRDRDKYVLMLLGTAIYLYGGMPFLKGMIGEIKSKSIGMMTLVALAISCLLYTSDAADERSSVDLGGRRIIKKKKNKYILFEVIISKIATSVTQ